MNSEMSCNGMGKQYYESLGSKKIPFVQIVSFVRFSSCGLSGLLLYDMIRPYHKKAYR